MAIKLPQINLPSFIMTTTLNITRIPGRCLTDFKRKPNISKTYPTASRCCRYLPHTSIQDRILRRFQHRWPTNLSLWTATSLVREDLVYRGYSNKVTWLMHSRRRATRTTIAAGQSPTFYEIQSNLKPSTEIFSLLANMHFTANLLREFVVISTVRIYHSGAKIINFSGDERGLNILEC